MGNRLAKISPLFFGYALRGALLSLFCTVNGANSADIKDLLGTGSTSSSANVEVSPSELKNAKDRARESSNVRIRAIGAKVEEWIASAADAPPAEGLMKPVGDGGCKQHASVSVFTTVDWSGSISSVAVSSHPSGVYPYDDDENTVSFGAGAERCVTGSFGMNIFAKPSVSASPVLFPIQFNIPMGATSCNVTVIPSEKKLMTTHCN